MYKEQKNTFLKGKICKEVFFPFVTIILAQNSHDVLERQEKSETLKKKKGNISLWFFLWTDTIKTFFSIFFSTTLFLTRKIPLSDLEVALLLPKVIPSMRL